MKPAIEPTKVKMVRRPWGTLGQIIQVAVMVLVFLLIFRTVAAEPYQVPTGSMWPALAGNHRAMDCPRCGYQVVVGKHRNDRGNNRDNRRLYRHAFCPNCGCTELSIHLVPECPGDHLLVNKSVFDLRSPRRWEMAVFRCPVDPNKAFVKRVVGLPGEKVQVRQGDIFVNGELARKNWRQMKALRIPVFDNNFQPRPDGFVRRFETRLGANATAKLDGTTLQLASHKHKRQYQFLVYRHFSLDQNQSRPIYDEYAYNGGEPRSLTPVHDFILECDLTIRRGSGWVVLGISDGKNRILAELPVRSTHTETVEKAACLREGKTPFAGGPAKPGKPKVYAQSKTFYLKPEKQYHIELALVDRRVIMVISGLRPFAVLDLPVIGRRREVIRPVLVGARGVDVSIENFKLFRDVHYTDAGVNGLRDVVSLGADEYFVLGDNSPNSDDSRFWPDRGVVKDHLLIGKPFLVHLPSRVVNWEPDGNRGRIVPDWGRIGWVR